MKNVFHYMVWRFLFLLLPLSFHSINSNAAFTYKNIRIPSLSSDSTGLFLRISVPKIKRYDCGAPIVIYVNGGFGAAGMLGSMFTMSNYGFIVIEFNFPGGGSGVQKSGGVFDNRDANSILALRDVIRFALGQTTDITGKYLSQFTGTKTPLYNNVGIIGGSNGGCSLLSTLGIYSEDFGALAWISFFESPIGDGMLTGDAGKPYGHAGVDLFLNTGYNDSTGNYNWDIFKMDMNKVAYYQKRDSVHGLFYFDTNNNNSYDDTSEFNIIGKPNIPYSNKYFYSMQIVRKAYEKGFYPLANPRVSFADSNLTKSYWYLRNGDEWIDVFMPNMPNLKVLFMVRDSDHITSAPNHPEALITWNKFNQSGCQWFRLNGDRSYIEYITGLSLPGAPDNDANTPLDNINIRNMIMPGNIFPDRYMNHYATSLEMADRVMNNNWSNNLEGLLSKICDDEYENEYEDKTETESPEETGTFLFPNPIQNETYIQVNSDLYGTSTIKIFDAIGRQVLPTQIDMVEKGFNLLVFESNSLCAGNYFIVLKAPGVASTIRFTKE